MGHLARVVQEGPLKGSLLAVAASALLAAAASAEPLDEALYAEILTRHTRPVADLARTRVAYGALADAPEWPRLLGNLQRTRPSRLADRNQRLAHWINAYNILAIDLVVRGYPLESIRDLGSLFRPVWRRPAGRIEGRELSLDEIEHEILRPMGDPRIHAAIVCASLSCPALRREPWTAARLDAQLDDSLRSWLADPRKGLRIDRERRRVHLSRIFDWFEADFEASGGVLAFVARYAPADAREWLEGNGAGASVSFLDYDWRLNDLAEISPDG
jgi:hypothetical protein